MLFSVDTRAGVAAVAMRPTHLGCGVVLRWTEAGAMCGGWM